ncbi:Exocyst complex component SEC3A [Tetrabaena socialis]|uniref:Exocyst complex component SEC3A n=1 Tax=Tetrabaena socialis TaxID=47790 RepID=A0A2J8AHF0_9CHLO|nr:Exocyst complex component SEC3A [Tetrabaena socialis]|eukprot:PNH11938.1 Exocyst complex component SEC3A [Tetrabaena socialis]
MSKALVDEGLQRHAEALFASSDEILIAAFHVLKVKQQGESTGAQLLKALGAKTFLAKEAPQPRLLCFTVRRSKQTRGFKPTVHTCRPPGEDAEGNVALGPPPAAAAAASATKSYPLKSITEVVVPPNKYEANPAFLVELRFSGSGSYSTRGEQTNQFRLRSREELQLVLALTLNLLSQNDYRPPRLVGAEAAEVQAWWAGHQAAVLPLLGGFAAEVLLPGGGGGAGAGSEGGGGGGPRVLLSAKEERDLEELLDMFALGVGDVAEFEARLAQEHEALEELLSDLRLPEEVEAALEAPPFGKDSRLGGITRAAWQLHAKLRRLDPSAPGGLSLYLLQMAVAQEARESLQALASRFVAQAVAHLRSVFSGAVEEVLGVLIATTDKAAKLMPPPHDRLRAACFRHAELIRAVAALDPKVMPRLHASYGQSVNMLLRKELRMSVAELRKAASLDMQARGRGQGRARGGWDGAGLDAGAANPVDYNLTSTANSKAAAARGAGSVMGSRGPAGSIMGTSVEESVQRYVAAQLQYTNLWRLVEASERMDQLLQVVSPAEVPYQAGFAQADVRALIAGSMKDADKKLQRMYGRVKKHMGNNNLAFRVWERIYEQLMQRRARGGRYQRLEEQMALCYPALTLSPTVDQLEDWFKGVVPTATSP